MKTKLEYLEISPKYNNIYLVHNQITYTDIKSDTDNVPNILFLGSGDLEILSPHLTDNFIHISENRKSLLIFFFFNRSQNSVDTK